MPGALVSVKALNGCWAQRTQTDSKGSYFLGAPVPGEYRLLAELPGLIKQARDVTLDASGTRRIDFALQHAPVLSSVTINEPGDLPEMVQRLRFLPLCRSLADLLRERGEE